jgi:hypothetical protein
VSASKGPTAVITVLVTVMFAAWTFDPDGSIRSLVPEVGGCLVVALLVLSASRAVHGRQPAAGQLVQIAVVTGTVFVASLPVLAGVWEVGAASSDLLGLGAGLAAAVVFGTVSGLSVWAAGVRGASGTVVASVLAAFALWPASLGWTSAVERRFPAPESPAAILAPVAVGAVGLTWLALRQRPRAS